MVAGLQFSKSFAQWALARSPSRRLSALDSEENSDVTPHPDQCLRTGHLDNKSMDSRGVSWTKHIISLTPSRVLISKVDDPMHVFDYVNLSEVVECELKASDEEGVNGPPPPSSTRFTRAFSVDNTAELDVQGTLELIIRTTEDGHNGGRSYIYRTGYSNAVAWEREIDEAVASAKTLAMENALREKYGHSTLGMVRARVRQLYHSLGFQFSVAGLIVFAFVLDVVQAEVLPAPESAGGVVMFWLDVAITSCFTLELLLNMFAHSEGASFINDKNFWFDLSVVGISIASVLLDVFKVGEMVPIKMVRLIRVVRVARLFPHFQQLNRIVHAVGSCVIPMVNAFIILLVATMIYAVIGTKLFSNRKPEYFADFSTSLFTMFQVLAGDSWSSAITRSFFVENEAGVLQTDSAVAFYFVTYVILGSITLLNVVVAVLLDEFLATVEREKEAAAQQVEIENDKRRIKGVLDPVTSKLCAFEDGENLQERIDNIYVRLDKDGSGGLNFEEFKDGLKSLPGIGRIHMTEDDFDTVTEQGKHLNDSGEFGMGEFRDMMKGELWRFSRRQLTNMVSESKSNEFKSTVLMLKMMETRLFANDAKIEAKVDAVGEEVRSMHQHLLKELQRLLRRKRNTSAVGMRQDGGDDAPDAPLADAATCADGESGGHDVKEKGRREEEEDGGSGGGGGGGGEDKEALAAPIANMFQTYDETMKSLVSLTEKNPPENGSKALLSPMSHRAMTHARGAANGNEGRDNKVHEEGPQMRTPPKLMSWAIGAAPGGRHASEHLHLAREPTPRLADGLRLSDAGVPSSRFQSIAQACSDGNASAHTPATSTPDRSPPPLLQSDEHHATTRTDSRHDPRGYERAGGGRDGAFPELDASLASFATAASAVKVARLQEQHAHQRGAFSPREQMGQQPPPTGTPRSRRSRRASSIERKLSPRRTISTPVAAGSTLTHRTSSSPEATHSQVDMHGLRLDGAQSKRVQQDVLPRLRSTADKLAALALARGHSGERDYTIAADIGHSRDMGLSGAHTPVDFAADLIHMQNERVLQRLRAQSADLQAQEQAHLIPPYRPPAKYSPTPGDTGGARGGGGGGGIRHHVSRHSPPPLSMYKPSMLAPLHAPLSSPIDL